ncbi:MAG: hypothetical protein COU25_03990 [Candidatus Levybacteria bacterium CG10_big_fil_rev_8_21_14_0_10_35_13]|nr:MAG: hypothetical protein COU25_03990 [Candidatus Levybacteria bacterium CG10_big_fil_rev_8_21_14_0_10_35_13]
MFKLSIITLNYNTKELTSNCIKAVGKIYKKELNENIFEIIVVDNNSKDDSVKQISNLKSQISNLTIIESKTNLGFGKGNNLGAERANGEYLLFLNSDTVIEDEGFVKMTDFMENHKETGILGGKLKNLDQTLQGSAGGSYNLWNVIFLLLGFERLGFLRESPRKVKKAAWVSGACMMIRKDVFKKLGGFEKELFMYMEDIDICFRAEKMGYSVYFFPDISLIHQERGSSNRTFAILNIYKGLLFFFKKHKPNWQFIFVKTILILKASVLTTLGKLTGNDYLYKTYKEVLAVF